MSPITSNMLPIFPTQTILITLFQTVIILLLLTTTTLSHPHPQTTTTDTNTLTSLSAANYTLIDDYTTTPETFFSLFSFFTSYDPTHGYVDYKDGLSAAEAGLIGYIPSSPSSPYSTNNATIYLGTDHTTALSVNSTTTRGRASVRLTSNARYNSNTLLIADISHMPTGCGTWPSLWLVGGGAVEDVWPAKGELDLIEGVNLKAGNTVSLHTSEGCIVDNTTAPTPAPTTAADTGTGTLITSDCDVAAANQSPNQGCGIALPTSTATPNYGPAFNAANGGIYALLWTPSGFSVWFFSHADPSLIPADISTAPDPSNFGTPNARFGGAGCDFDAHFRDMSVVFDTTFCGDWAGLGDWEQGGCAAETGYARCEDFVAERAEMFGEAWWGVRGLWVFGIEG